MKITDYQKSRIHKLVNKFIEDNKLLHYSGDIQYVEEEKCDENTNKTLATIYFHHDRREYLINVFIDEIDNFESLKETILHELTHLFFYEVDEFYRFLIRDTENDVLKMACEKMYESITYKTTELFKAIYLC